MPWAKRPRLSYYASPNTRHNGNLGFDCPKPRRRLYGACRFVTLEVALIGPDGKTVKTAETVPQAVAAGKSADFQQEIAVKFPDIWNLDHPVLYRAVASVRAGKTTLDDEAVPFGIREFHSTISTSAGVLALDSLVTASGRQLRR